MSSDNPTIARLQVIGDPVERAAACQTFITNGRATLRAAERLRDDAIRTARSSATRPTVDDLARKIGTRRNIVVDALRERRAL